MQCPGCQSIVEDGFKFCMECGTALSRACPSCGYANPAAAKFCSDCSFALSSPSAGVAPAAKPDTREPASQAQAERRHISVMFCDMVGSSAL